MGSDEASLQSLVGEEGEAMVAQRGTSQAWLKYGKGLLAAALVLSAFASGAAFAKNTYDVPTRSSGVDRAVGLVSTKEEAAAMLSAATAGKPQWVIDAIFAQVRDGTITQGPLLELQQYLNATPTVKTALVGEIAASVQARTAPANAASIRESHVPPPANNSENHTCLDVQAWHAAFIQYPAWRKYSQSTQDSVFTSLFSWVGVTNRFYVEFGFNQLGYLGIGKPSGPNSQWIDDHNTASGANTALMHFDWGWKGLLMDGGFEFEPDNLHKEWITPGNIASLFQKYNVPQRVDYVSIDIDSCDLWVFVGLIKGPGNFRPRVLTVEYNSNYPLESSRTNRCVDADGKPYFFKNDNMYGASLGALHKAAEMLNYTMVYTTRGFDVFLVDNALICPGTELPLETFRFDTSIPAHVPGDGVSRQVAPEERTHWVVNYTGQDYHVNNVSDISV
jgi:hypothetical protein